MNKGILDKDMKLLRSNSLFNVPNDNLIKQKLLELYDKIANEKEEHTAGGVSFINIPHYYGSGKYNKCGGADEQNDNVIKYQYDIPTEIPQQPSFSEIKEDSEKGQKENDYIKNRMDEILRNVLKQSDYNSPGGRFIPYYQNIERK